MSMLKLDVEGKYTILLGIENGRFRFEALRGGEPWVDFVHDDRGGCFGSKMWIAVVHELAELREAAAMARNPWQKVKEQALTAEDAPILMAQRDLLADALHEVLVHAGVMVEEAPVDGPILLLAAQEYCHSSPARCGCGRATSHGVLCEQCRVERDARAAEDGRRA